MVGFCGVSFCCGKHNSTTKAHLNHTIGNGIVMNHLKEYDVVRVTKLDQPNRHYDGTESVKRLPQIGDLGTIVHVYSGAQDINPAYIVECVDRNGFTVWMADFTAGELELVEADKFPKL